MNGRDGLDALTRADKRAQLERLLRERLNRPGPGGSHPLSYGQRAMWFLHQLARESTAYNLGEALAVRGGLDAETLRRALSRLVTRHGALRTTFASGNDGEPEQTVHERLAVPLEEHDASGWSDDELTTALSADIDRPFDLAAGPPVRLSLYRRGADDHVVVLSLHHIVGELWALILLVDELWALYRAEASGSEPELRPATSEYTDFVRWQLDVLAGPEGDRLTAFWQQELGDDPPTLNLPTDRPRPRLKTYNGAIRAFDLDPEVAQEVKRFAREQGVTLYATLLAAYVAFLHRYSGQRELIVGTPMTGRVEARWLPVVGYFDNPLPIRGAIEDGMTFAALLERTRASVLRAFEHQAMPFPLLVERAGADRDPSRSPLFDVMFVLRRAQIPGMEQLAAMAMGRETGTLELSEGLSGSSIELDRCVSQFDLTLSVAELDGGLAAGWEYNRDLFDEATIDRMSVHFAVLLQGLVATPDAPIASVPILTEGERRRLGEWNASEATTSAGALLHHGFEEQVRTRPGATAVVQGSMRLTYGELDAHATRVAAWLRDHGARPNRLVAIAMHKGWEQVVAALAVLKAGAAYLPLDPGLPHGRLEHLLEIGEVELVLTQPAVEAALAWPAGLRVLVVDEHTPGNGETAPCPAGAGDLAYVIFTSGSTGVPKGVMIEHGAAANTVHDVNARFEITARDRTLAISSLSFDLSVWDLFGTLGAGGAVVIPEAARQHEPDHWLELVRQEQVTIWNSVPMLLKLLTEDIEAAPATAPAAASLRLALLSGDWVPTSLPDRVRALVPGLDVVSLGGATEVSIWSVLYRIGTVDPAWTSIPYGRPMANQRLYVLNDGLEPCPDGVAGRIYIGGVGLARGYWRDADRTAQSFIVHPRTGERLYDTGDLAKFRADGETEFLGRADHQVKVRGFRVELGEIEAVLRERPSVEDAAVTARRTQGENRLAAFVVGDASDEHLEHLRSYCAERLPDYMVPAAFVILDTLPLSGNGKVDRGALPDAFAATAAEPGVAPRTATERKLAGVWREVLGLEAVSVDEGFVELGGDSVSAIRVCSQARHAGLRVSPRDLFLYPTVAELAGHMDACQPVPAASHAATSAEPLSPMQRTMLLHGAYEDVPALYCEQVLLDIEGDLDAEVLRAAWERVVDRWDVLRSSFDWDGPDGFTRRVLPTMPVDFDTYDWRGLERAERDSRLESFLESDRRRGFDVTSPPLSRWTLVRLEDRVHRLVWTHHHVLFDGWSLTLLLRDVASCFAALRKGREPVLDPVPDTSAYATWRAGRDTVAAERFWREELAGFASATDLGIGARSDDALEPFQHGERAARLTPSQTEALVRFGRANGVTLNTLVTGAWALLLSRYSGDDDVLFGVTASGRPSDLDGVEEMVGLFINTVPLRVPVPAAERVSAWLKALQRRSVQIREFEWVAAEQVARWSDLAEPARPFGLYESILVFENYPVDHDGLGAEGVAFHDVRFSEQTNTPLMLYAIPAAELELRVTYDARRFTELEIERLLGHLAELITGFVRDADEAVASVPMLTAGERRALGVLGSGAPLARPAPPVLEPILARAASVPDTPALEQDGRVLTYREAVQAAELLGLRLQAAGITRGATVGVFLERTPELVIAQLAALLAGGAFLAIDPAHPDEHVAFVLADAGVGAVVTTSELADRLPERPGMAVIVDGADEARLHGGESVETAPGDLAYVLYTSGSTGRPKGVLIEHGSLAHFTAAAAETYDIGVQDRVLQFSAPSFDASIEEIFPALTHGATVVLRTDAMLDSMAGFLRACGEQRITVLDLPTAFWHELVLGLERGLTLPESVRLVIIGGERALGSRLALWRQHVPAGVRLLNTYGPTETTVVVTAATLTDDHDEVPIGRPLAGASLAVVDHHGQPAPIGVTGELYVGGAQVARGYHDRSGLTAARFVAPPLEWLSGRVYRTGDLVRWRADGALEFVGRTDDQVKISGYRVEPAEVAAVLDAHPAVREAAVVAREDATGERTLVGYIVAAQGTPLRDDALRAYLRERLPAHLVPGAFVTVETLPRTPAGKLDRRALPEPVPSAGGRGGSGDMPRTRVEAQVAGVWSSLLNLEDIDVHADFFELGGRSLQTIQLASRLSGAFGREIAVRTVLMNPTIAKLAAVITEEPEAPVRAEQVAAPACAPAVSEHMTIEHRPLLDLVVAGRIAPVDAAALTYLPPGFENVGLSREAIVEQWCHGLPVVSEILELPQGRIACVMLPRFASELYLPESDVLGLATEALRTARVLDARVVSLTGLLPSATGLGADLAERAAGGDLPAVTTGHGTTAAAVVIAVRSLLERTDRRLESERLGVLGVGSVGLATLRLLLGALPHPAHIALCDVYEKRDHLEQVQEELRGAGYRGVVSIHASATDVPDAFYDSTLVVGATNAPDVLDVERLRPGTLVVDDSAPHCFSLDAAVRRQAERRDILCTEGGFVRSAAPIPRLRHWPRELDDLRAAAPVRSLFETRPDELTGCVLSSLLTASFDDLVPTTGLVPATGALAHLAALDRLGFGGAAPRLEAHTACDDVIAAFRRAHGGRSSP